MHSFILSWDTLCELSKLLECTYNVVDMQKRSTVEEINSPSRGTGVNEAIEINIPEQDFFFPGQ